MAGGDGADLLAHRSRGRRVLLVLLLLLTPACERPCADWIAELRSDEPLTRALAAAAIGKAAKTPEEADTAVKELFAIYRPNDVMAPWIVHSLDPLANTAWQVARSVLRAEARNADIHRLLGLVRDWMAQTCLPAQTVDGWLLAEVADRDNRHPERLFPLLQARGMDLSRIPDDAPPALRIQIVLQRCADSPGDAANRRALHASTGLLLVEEVGAVVAEFLAADPGACTALLPQIHTLPSGRGHFYRVLIAVLARHVADGKVAPAAAIACLGGGNQDLETVLIEGTQSPDLELASLCCLGLTGVGERPAAIRLLQQIAADERRPAAVRGAARIALDVIGK